ncbi:MAG: hypothetical protein NZ927_04380 [Candidatus Calescibacterium sp.]|nr:hypothetical protein [Candidatus Calescibacterium sp.]MCX7733307.1 hypothetical protein [bacterium]
MLCRNGGILTYMIFRLRYTLPIYTVVFYFYDREKKEQKSYFSNYSEKNSTEVKPDTKQLGNKNTKTAKSTNL